MDFARRDLVVARKALADAKAGQKAQLHRATAFNQKDGAVKARFTMINACYTKYPEFDYASVKEHLKAPKRL